MKVQLDSGEVIDLGTTATAPTIGIIDYSRRVTDDYGVTTVVERGFARRMSVQVAVPFETVDAVQRRLADLRATSALWIADERFASLSVRGFYKEFSIDIASPPLSFCTLSVEGLTGTDDLVDSGNDPAPTDQTSTLQLVQPVTIANAQLVASNVAETDAAEWSASVAYARGVRVIKTATHRIYESVASIAAGDDPEGTSGKWLNVGPTNRWAMFDQALGSVTTANRNVAVTVNAGAIDSVALLDVAGDTVRVQATGYDRTLPVAEGAITFLDLPANPGQVTVTVIGGGVVSIGTLIVGKRAALGLTEASPTAAITDYSRKVVDEFGEATVVPRAWAKRMTANALIRTKAIDFVMKRISAVRATPCLWIGQDGLDSLTIYGFFKDFSIEVGEGVSKLALTIEGLSTAGKVEPLVASAAWPDITDPTGEKPANNADVTGDNTSKDTKAVAGKPAGEVADAVSASDGSTILTRDVKAALLVATSAIASATAAIAAAQGQIAAAQSLIDSVKAQAATAQGRADDAIVQVGAAAADATAAKTQASAAQSRADQALSGVAAAGGQIDSLRTLTETQGSQIDTNASAISNAKGDLATLTTRIAAGSPNLVPNASFENSFVNWTPSGPGWSVGLSRSWGQIAYTNSDVPDNTFVFVTSDLIEVYAAPHTLTADMVLRVAGGSGRAYVQIDWIASDRTTVVGAIGGPNVFNDFDFSVSGDGRQKFALTAAPPANAAFARVYCVALKSSGVLKVFGVRQVKFEYGDLATAYTSEAQVLQTAKAVSTLDTQYASLTSIVSTQGASITQNASALSSLGTNVANLTMTVSAQGATITSNANAISAVGTTVANLTTTVSSQGASITNNANAVSALGSSLASLTSTVSAQGSQISSNATAISNVAGNLATLDTKVLAGNANLILNGGFENGLVGWSANALASWTTGVIWGAYAYLSAPYAGAAIVLVQTEAFRAAPGCQYTVTGDAHVFADRAASSAYIDMIFLDGNGGFLPGGDSDQSPIHAQTDFSPTGANRAALKTTWVSPAGTAKCVVRFVIDPAGGTITGAGCRQVKMEVGAQATAYSSEASAVQSFKALSTLDTQYASMSSAVSAQGVSITQNASALSSLGTTVASLSTRIGSAEGNISVNASAISSISGTVSNLSSVVSTQGSSISSLTSASSTQAGLIATLQTQVVAGGGNLLQNTDFAADTSGWSFAQNGTSHSGMRDLLGDAYRPTNEHTLCLYGSNANGGDFAYWQSAVVPVVPGKNYEASAGAANSRARTRIYLRFLDANGGLVGDYTADRAYYSEGSALSSFPTLFARGRAPENAKTVVIIMFKGGTDGGYGDSYAWFVRPQLVEVPTTSGGPVAYSPGATGAIISQQATALANLNQSFASLSSTVSTQGASITQNANALSALGSNAASLSSTVSVQGASISQNAQAISSTNQQVANLTSTVSAQGVSISQTFNAISAVQNNVNLALARWAIRLDVNGRWIGIEANNNGSYGEIDIVADKFKISDPNGSVGIEVGGGSIRTYHPNGRLATRQGRW